MSHHSSYAPVITDRVCVTEDEVEEELTKQRAELKAQLRALLKAEQAAYKQVTAELEEGELLDTNYKYIQSPSRISASHPQPARSSKSTIPVYKEPASASSCKRKADDEGGVPDAKRQVWGFLLKRYQEVVAEATSRASQTGPPGERGARLDTASPAEIEEGDVPMGEGFPEQTAPEVGRRQPSKERNVRKPMSRLAVNAKVGQRHHALPEIPVPEVKQPINRIARAPPMKVDKISKEHSANTSRDARSKVENRKEARTSVHPPANPPVGAESAFSQINKRNKEILRNQRIQDAVNRRLRRDEEKKTPTNKSARKAPRQADTKVQSGALSKKLKPTKSMLQPEDNREPMPDWQRTFTTAPAKPTAAKPVIAQIPKSMSEKMVSVTVSSMSRKRKAEEGLKGSSIKLTKVNKGPSTAFRAAGAKPAAAPKQEFTINEVSGRGKKLGEQDFQRIRVPRDDHPGERPQLDQNPAEQREEVRRREEKKNEVQPATGKPAMKRESEDEAGSDRLRKKARITEPKGLSNFRRACFANGPLQCLLGIPEVADHYGAFASGLVPEVEEIVASCPDLDKKGSTSRKVGKQRYDVRKSFHEHREEISLSAYLGDLAHRMATEKERSTSPFKFLQAFGTLFRDDGSPLNGETSQEAKQFVDELLQRLDQEEREQSMLEGNPDKSTLVQQLLGVKTTKHFYCAACGFSTDEDPIEHTSINVVLPRDKGTATLADLLMSTGKGQLLEDCECLNPRCNVRNRTIERYELNRTSKYLIVQAPRVGEKLDKDGRSILDNKGDKIPGKIHEKIQFADEVVDLSALKPVNEKAEDVKYELFGMVMHRGVDHYDGHYMALRKVGQQWFECNDEHITIVPKHRIDDYDNGQLFFLRRVE